MFIACLLAALTILVPRSHATSFYEAPFAEALKETPVFVRGTIGKSEVQPVLLPDGTQVPFTFYDLKVTEMIKGNIPAPQLRFRQLGGDHNTMGFSVSGSAEFSSGEDVVLMLDEPSTEAGDGAYPLRGLSTGKYIVDQTADGREYLVGSGIPAEKLALDEVRKLVQPKPPEASASGIAGSAEQPRPLPSPSLEASLLQRASPAPAKLGKNHTDETAPPAAPSKVWILIVGGLIGAGWYRWSRPRR